MIRQPSTMRVAVLGAALAVLAGGCVHQGEPRVGVKDVSASLVFGVKEAKPLPSAPAVIPDIQQGGGFSVIDLGSGGIDLSNPRTPPPAKSDCPVASVTAAPLKATEADITGPPVPGLYKWKRSGTFTTSDGAKLPFGGYEGRVITNVKKIDDNTYTFQMIQPRVDQALLQVSTFQVKENATKTQAGGTNGVPIETVRDPEGGVVLKRIEYYNENGQIQSSSTFNPGSGVLLLPLPVISGEQYKSVSIDARDGRTIESDATVTRRQRVDACGDLVDGWEVDTQWTDSNNGQTISYRYIIATQYGGVLISEIQQPADTASATGQAPPGVQPFENDLSWQLAQLNPSAIPDSFKL